MGGRDENWSFFLYEDFSNGSSTSGIATFEKCWLAGEMTFKMKNVEVWSIGEKCEKETEVQDELNRQRASSKKNETRLLLEMSGKEFHGDSFNG